MELGNISLPFDEEVRKQSSGIKYDLDGFKIRLESKRDSREKSPDIMDMFSMGQYPLRANQKAKIIGRVVKYREGLIKNENSKETNTLRIGAVR
jgi:hypothetical protein